MTSNLDAYDLVVLGGGPAGIMGALTAAALGKSVALVDSHRELGGAGINTGTVPSKTLRETALTLSGARSHDLYGVDLSLKRDATVPDFLRHERVVKGSLNTMLGRQLEESGADVYQGIGVLEDSNTVRVRPSDTAVSGVPDRIIRANHILVATGSSPVRPSIFPFGSPRIYDSDTILELDRLPKTMAIVGGGTIGCEYACIFAALHIDVHLLDGRNRLLPFLDMEIGNSLAASMERSGITFHLNQQVQSCRATPGEDVMLVLTSGSLNVEAALIAAGRKSNTEMLNLAAAGVTTGQRGLIEVNKDFQTNAPHIYAAGDVIGPPALVSTSMEQARRAVRHAFARQRSHSDLPALFPTGVYTIPEVGMVGETEETLEAKGLRYVVGRASYERNARGKIIGDEDGLLKLLFLLPDLTLIGVHIVGERATVLVHVGLIAMLCHCTAHIFAEACFNLPTLGHMYKTAALDAMSRSIPE